MLYKFYNFITLIFSPVIYIYLLLRKQIGKEDKQRFKERLGYTKIDRPAGALIWFHAASVGEAVSVLPLISKIKTAYPKINILMTTGTVTSSKMLSERLPKNIIHQFVPIDKKSTVKRFINHWQPNIGLWVESELWPNLIIETYKSGAQLILLNARMSLRSYSRWKNYRTLAKQMLSCFSLCLAQSDDDKERFEKLGCKNVKHIGNLKYDSPPLPYDPKEMFDFISQIKDRPVWLAASTHEGEEEIVYKVHKKLRKKYPNILTIIAPRHPERGKEIKEKLRKSKKIILRSKGKRIVDETEVYIANTIGDLGLFYRLSKIAFIGGSFIKHGGQNPLEPARLDCAIITGENVGNFKAVYEEMKKEKAVYFVKNGEELYIKVLSLLKDSKKTNDLAHRAFTYVQSKSGIIDAYVEKLTGFLKSV